MLPAPVPPTPLHPCPPPAPRPVCARVTAARSAWPRETVGLCWRPGRALPAWQGGCSDAVAEGEQCPMLPRLRPACGCLYFWRDPAILWARRFQAAQPRMRKGKEKKNRKEIKIKNKTERCPGPPVPWHHPGATAPSPARAEPSDRSPGTERGCVHRPPPRPHRQHQHRHGHGPQRGRLGSPVPSP